MSDRKQEDYSSIEKKITGSLIVGGVLILFVFGMYFYNFNGDLNIDPDKWGPFGDFIGGTLNPILAALAFYWLTASIRLQIQELRETKIELRKAAEAQEKSERHQEALAKLEDENVKTQKQILSLQQTILESQQKVALVEQQKNALQSFENLFFQLLQNLNGITNNIQAGSSTTYQKFIGTNDVNTFNARKYIRSKFSNETIKVKGKESIKDHIIFFKAHSVESWSYFYDEAIDDYFGSYFRTCYQIVKLIDENETLIALKKTKTDLYSDEQKKYFDIFRAQLSSYELEAIFFNCIEGYGQGKFQEMIERYGLFEHLLLDHQRTYEEKNRLTNYAYKYKDTVFQDSPNWKDYFKEIQTIQGRQKYRINENQYQKKLILE